jgi:aspartyl/asparaginyl-tRNA synthetase
MDKQGAQAEIHVASTVIRLRSNTDISFLNLDDHTLQIQLTGGALDIKVRHLSRNVRNIKPQNKSNDAWWDQQKEP